MYDVIYQLAQYGHKSTSRIYNLAWEKPSLISYLILNKTFIY